MPIAYLTLSVAQLTLSDNCALGITCLSVAQLTPLLMRLKLFVVKLALSLLQLTVTVVQLTIRYRQIGDPSGHPQCSIRIFFVALKLL